GVTDRHPEAAHRLIRQLSGEVPLVPISRLVPRCDLLIEAASHSAVEEILPAVTKHRKALLVMSTGGLLACPGLLARALARGVAIHLPSGALAGVDALKAASFGKILRVRLTSTKPPSAFRGVMDLRRRKIDLGKIRKPRLLFEGTARSAARDFPQNANVAATLALAAPLAPIRVKILADPGIRRNIHEVELIGSFGRVRARTENRPSRENPKTSELAALSAIATLRGILQPLKVGT
ncbi:MAG: DUF108 domain-containing protein, partial [Candidatus Omnitrophica bacterium]|nr:DUF108 domain-containing protein [Candidatus Omnitrophota bacterium]